MADNGSKDIFAEMGRIATWSTELELCLRGVAGSLIDEYRKYSQIITAELPYRKLINLVLNLYRSRHGADEHFSDLKNSQSEFLELQNKLVRLGKAFENPYSRENREEDSNSVNTDAGDGDAA